jgi:DNA-binding NarL/FixJ family response regulator
MDQPFRILALHHNSILRDGISILIETHEGLHLVGSVAEPGPAVLLFEKERPDLTLIDLDLPADTGLGALHQIKAMDAEAVIIGLVTYDWSESVSRAMELGATAVLAKDLLGELLIPFIQAARLRTAMLHVFEERSTP